MSWAQAGLQVQASLDRVARARFPYPDLIRIK